MAKIRKRNDGVYEKRIQINGKRYSVYSKNKQELYKKFNELKKTLYKTPINKKHITLNEWFEKWFNTYKKPFITEKSAKNIEIYFNVHMKKKLGNENIKDLTGEKLQLFFNKMPSSRTKELVFTYLRAMLVQAYNLELIKRNPFVNIVKDKKIKTNIKSLTIKEQIKLINHLRSSDKTYYYYAMIYLVTGIRRGELKRLSVEGNKLYVNGTKTDNAKRVIPITEKFKQEILSKVELNNIDVADNYLSQKFGMIFKELKIKSSLHSLRHSFTTNLYHLGYDAKILQTWLGHSSIQITLDIYTNIDGNLSSEDKILVIKTYEGLYP